MIKFNFSENQLKIISQTSAQLWSAFLQFLSIPIYFILLGPESYGLLGIYSSLESLIIIIDMTISSTLSREVARSLITQSRGAVKYFILFIGKFYFLLVLVFSIAIYLAAKILFDEVLKDSQGLIADKNIFTIIIIITIATRLGISYVRSILIGDQKQINLSIISIFFVSIRLIGSFFLLYFFSNDLIIFLLWNIIIFLAEFIAICININKVFGKSNFRQLENNAIFKSIFNFAPKMFLLSISSLIITQSDRILISLKYDLSDLGEYNFFKNIVLGMFILSGGIYSFLYPTISSQFIKKEWKKIDFNSRLCASAISRVLFPLGVFLIFLGQNVLVFTNVEIEFTKNPVFIYLVLGTIFNLLWMIPYILQLASGLVYIPLSINIFCIFPVIGITWIGFDHLGLFSVAVAYLLYNILMLIIGVLLLDKYFVEIKTSKIMIESSLRSIIFGLIFFYISIYFIFDLGLIIQFIFFTLTLLLTLNYSLKQISSLKS